MIKKLLIAALIITAIVLIIIFRKKIAAFFGIATAAAENGCNNFYVKLSDLGNKKIQSLHVWTSGEKYYKQEGIIIPDGIESEKQIIEITKQEFDGFCKDKFNVPAEYKWYYEKPGTSTGH